MRKVPGQTGKPAICQHSMDCWTAYVSICQQYWDSATRPLCQKYGTRPNLPRVNNNLSSFNHPRWQWANRWCQCKATLGISYALIALIALHTVCLNKVAFAKFRWTLACTYAKVERHWEIDVQYAYSETVAFSCTLPRDVTFVHRDKVCF